ncbi:trypsin-like peptidase domain-containing protein [Mycolicibacterium rufum]|uniref:Trypsin-like peptidase domain-containing protein n=1 Tax=Mycolicibacterium rufum TaxID=318424 RepID=A0ABY3UIR4_9MYCO|nr:trypsin-like peptidase domain-containing protein [Mycolicibacterium rufum]KGI67900.1 trypsin [Mycolicibacterium rufum]ULP39501.1 trypsin-like peptidase domain-containing protein [Mycolicibacterium rufum]
MGPCVPVRLAAAAMTAAVLTSCGAAYPVPPQAAEPVVSTAPSAHPVAPDPRVGAVFLGADGVHVCSASVLSSAVADLILTAAHCVADNAEETFVPGFSDTHPAEAGRRLDAVYLDPRWVRDQDPAADFAVARVSRDDGPALPTVAGGGLHLGAAPAPGTEVTVVGYGYGVGGGPTACTAATAAPREGFPAVHCDGIVAGFSGAPWIAGSTVVGVIGGLDGGGCLDEVSYSPRFDGALAALVARAEAGGPSDTPPAAFDDGCG